MPRKIIRNNCQTCIFFNKQNNPKCSKLHITKMTLGLSFENIGYHKSNCKDYSQIENNII